MSVVRPLDSPSRGGGDSSAAGDGIGRVSRAMRGSRQLCAAGGGDYGPIQLNKRPYAWRDVIEFREVLLPAPETGPADYSCAPGEHSSRAWPCLRRP